jgi:hypothetical protein
MPEQQSNGLFLLPDSSYRKFTDMVSCVEFLILVKVRDVSKTQRPTHVQLVELSSQQIREAQKGKVT